MLFHDMAPGTISGRPKRGTCFAFRGSTCWESPGDGYKKSSDKSSNTCASMPSSAESTVRELDSTCRRAASLRFWDVEDSGRMGWIASTTTPPVLLEDDDDDLEANRVECRAESRFWCENFLFLFMEVWPMRCSKSTVELTVACRK